jgi:26S proteasome regulatory subunit N2
MTYSSSEPIVHGASLGLGLSAMGLNSEELFDLLFTCVSGCDAVAGEGAALGIGLTMMGSGNQRIIEMLKCHACEFNQKEKIIRGLVMAIAIIMLGREDESRSIIDELLVNGDPWVRVGGCFTIGTAYAGTANTKAIERLLEIAVRDVNDEVRRNAVTMIGFVAFKDPQLCVELTRILADSYNPHIRYGVALALGVAAAGSGLPEAVNLLWGLSSDLVDFVRQGAFIALSIVLVQVTERENPKAKDLRAELSKRITDRKEDSCTKFGCIIATGLLDAGGRNCTISMHKHRHRIDKAVAGMFIICQHWYWFPYILMASLAMQPTCIIALNEQLEMPRYTMRSNVPPSYFAIPKSVQQSKKELKEKEQKAVELSTVKREMEFRDKKSRGEHSRGSISVTTPLLPSSVSAEEKPPEQTSAAEAKESEYEELQNPARVTLRQLDFVSHSVDGRYAPVKPNPMGVCMLLDKQPDSGKAELVDAINPMDRDDDVKPPEPFVWP